MSLTRDEARALINQVLEMGKADETSVSIESNREANLRYAHSEVSTSGDTEDVVVTVRSSFGKRTGSASTNQTDGASLRRVVAVAEETARLSREDPEFLPMLGPQTYGTSDPYDEATANTTPAYRASIAAKAIEMGKRRNLEMAGFFTNSATVQALGNSRGLFAFSRGTLSTFSNTARSREGAGSGWAGTNAGAVSQMNPLALVETAARKAELSRNAKQIDPGTYTVILEPSAVADLLLYLTFQADARSADEGRSFFAKKGGGTKIGERIVSEKVSIWTDPGDVRVPGSSFSGDGLPTIRVPLIESGVLKSLNYSRFWAQKMNASPTPSPTNIIMKGGSGTLDDLIKSAKNAILVTRLWYIRSLDPQTILLTGLTRDGVFKIESGRIRHAVKNFRWNDSPVSVLSNIEAMSQEYRARGSESEDFAIICPAVRTKFTFASLSDAV